MDTELVIESTKQQQPRDSLINRGQGIDGTPLWHGLRDGTRIKTGNLDSITCRKPKVRQTPEKPHNPVQKLLENS